MTRQSLTKKSTSTSEQTRRNGQRETRKKVVEEVVVVSSAAESDSDEEDEGEDGVERAVEYVDQVMQDGEDHERDEQEEEDENRDAKTEPMSVVRESQESGVGPGKSVYLEELMEKMVMDQRKRFNIRKDKIHKQYETNVEETKQAVNTLFEHHESESSLIHDAQMKLLQELLEQKAQLEAQMGTVVADLRRRYARMCQDLRVVAEHHASRL